MATFGLAFIVIGGAFIPVVIGVAQGRPVLTLGDWGFILFALATLLGFAVLGVYVMRYDAFRLTHYPIRGITLDPGCSIPGTALEADVGRIPLHCQQRPALPGHRRLPV